MSSPTTAKTPRETILIVDDDPGNLGALGRLLRPHYEVLAAPSGTRALDIAAGAKRPDLILLDVLMPQMDGHAVLTRLREQAATRDIPVIFVTGLDSFDDEERGLERGAVDYIAKPFNPAVVLARIHTQLELKHVRDRLHEQNLTLEAEVMRRTEDIRLVQDVTIDALAELAEIRDNETGYHVRRCQEYVRSLGRRLQGHPRFADVLDDQVVEMLAKSAALHDIGKVGIPDEILLKPGKLTAEEWEVMKTHSRIGARAIERAVQKAGRSVDFLDTAMQIARWHHEKWDGSGYPDGLVGEAIPVAARLMAIADVFDALTTPRVYKPGLPFERARAMIAAERGRHFDPDMVDAFQAGFAEFVAIAERYHNPAH